MEQAEERQKYLEKRRAQYKRLMSDPEKREKRRK
jgi:hypothetical protein